jgi:hypothetical protein
VILDGIITLLSINLCTTSLQHMYIYIYIVFYPINDFCMIEMRGVHMHATDFRHKISSVCVGKQK